MFKNKNPMRSGSINQGAALQLEKLVSPSGPQPSQRPRVPQAPIKNIPISAGQRGASQVQNKARGTASSAVRTMMP